MPVIASSCRKPALLCLFLMALGPWGAAHAQCMLGGTTTQMFGNTISVIQYFPGPENCSLVSSNAQFCFPSDMAMKVSVTFGLQASANLTATTAPFCEWNCDCGTARIDGSDGLPVELLEFEIDDSSSETDEPEK